MSLAITYELKGATALRYRLMNMRDQRKERAALEDIGRQIHLLTMLRFETETDPWGRPWAPLASSTVKRRRLGSRRILQDTGNLRRSYTWRVGRHQVAVGTFGRVNGKPPGYARYHQTGTSRMPARKMLPEKPWPKTYTEAVETVIRHYYGVHYQQHS